MLRYRQPVEFRIGDVLSLSWRVLVTHASRGMRTLIVLFVLSPLDMAIGSLGYATVVFAVFQDLRGRPVSVGESLRRVAGHLLQVIPVAVLSGIAQILGLLCCLAPGLFVMSAWGVAMPACVVERPGVVHSLTRSAKLTAGHRWPILGVGVAWTIVVLLVSTGRRRAAGGAEIRAEVLSWMWTVTSGSFGSVYAAILYYDLGAVREGIGIEAIAAVFD